MSIYERNIALANPTWGMNCHYQGSRDIGLDGYDEYWINNDCLMYSTDVLTYSFADCDTAQLKNNVPNSYQNFFYYPDGGQFYVACSTNGVSRNLTLAEYQKLGYETSTQQFGSLPTLPLWGYIVRLYLGITSAAKINAK